MKVYEVRRKGMFGCLSRTSNYEEAVTLLKWFQTHMTCFTYYLHKEEDAE